MGIYISGFAFLVGFAIVWHILWLGLLGLIGVIGCILARSWMMIRNMSSRQQMLSGWRGAMEDDVKVFGFWVYLMTDLVIFAVLFATFIVLRPNTFGGPTGQELFDLSFALKETLVLLTSSFTCALATLALYKKQKKLTIFWFFITFALDLLPLLGIFRIF